MVEVHLDLSDPASHRVGVTLRLKPRLSRMRLQFPGWTPGSYLIRDYVRQLEGLEVRQGEQRLEARRLSPACWQICPDPAGPELEIRYGVMAIELTVRTPHLDADHGFLPLAGVVLELEGERWSAHRLHCSLISGWQAFSSLPGDPNTGFVARDFDQLLDSPLEVGPHPDWAFSVAGVPHRLVCWGGEPGRGLWLLERFPDLLADLERVCLACCRLMGVERPAAEQYLLVLHLVDEGYGGLEHDDGTVLVYGRSNLVKAGGYRRFLQLVAHEYLHQWNVRRLRPAELCPIDYHQPVSVPSLWFAEGVTSYVDQLLPLIAGLSSREDLLEDLGAELSRYRLTAGRSVQSLRSSSQEAWVKLYRPDAYSADSQVSYYLKGAVVALCLDLHLHAVGSCLAAVLQGLWCSHGRWGRGYSEADLIEAFAQRSADLRDRLPQWLESVDDPNLDGYLNSVGLSLEPVAAASPWIGMTVAVESGQLLARRVQRGSPAQQAGVMVGDELVGLDGQRLREPAQLAAALRAGELQELLITRRSQLRSLSVCSQAARPESFRLVADPSATAQQHALQERWLALLPSPNLAIGTAQTACAGVAP